MLGLADFGKAGTGWGALSERYNAQSRGPGKPSLQSTLDAVLGTEAPLPEALKALLGEGKRKKDSGLLEAFTPAAFEETRVKKGQSAVTGGALATAAEALLSAAEAFEAGLTHTLFRAFQQALATHKEQRQLRGPEDALRQLAASLRGASGKALAERLAALSPGLHRRVPGHGSGAAEHLRGPLSRWGPGTLVLIGDPKQAIYGFRGADLFLCGPAGPSRRRSAAHGSELALVAPGHRNAQPLLPAAARSFPERGHEL